MAFFDDGSWTQRFHPGWAAQSSRTAARLALAGFESPTDAYEVQFGSFPVRARLPAFGSCKLTAKRT